MIKLSSVVTTVCVIVIIFVVFFILHTDCKTAKRRETFTFTMNNNIDDYDKTSSDCSELYSVIMKGAPIDDEYKVIAQMLRNNLYKDKNGEYYGTNQCIIQDIDLTALGIGGDCRIDNDTVLEKNNQQDALGSWVIPDGCVINESQVRNLPSILQKIKNKRDMYQKKLQDDLTAQAEIKAREASKLNNESNDLSNQALLEKQSAYAYQSAEEAAESQRRGDEQTVATYRNIASQFQILAEDIDNLRVFIQDKIVGIRWYVYNGYFEEAGKQYTNTTNKWLDDIWNGNRVPFDGGIIKAINGYEKMLGITGTYSQTMYTQGVTYVFEFLFLPDTTGIWGFEIASDDASYLWVSSDESRSEPSTTGVLGSGPNPMQVGSGANDAKYMCYIDNGGGHGFKAVNSVTREPLTAGKLYKIRMVQGNWNSGTPNNRGNPQGVRLQVRRPGVPIWFVLTSGEKGVGQNQSDRWFNRLMVFDYRKKGMFAKVYTGYFNDQTVFFKNNKPLAAVRLQEAYNMNDRWVRGSMLGHGILKNRSFKNAKELVMTDSKGKNVPLYELGYENWPADNTKTRTISFFGYFKAPYSGKFRFYFAGDDAIYAWFGDRAFENNVTGRQNAFDMPGGIDLGGPDFMRSIPGPHPTLSSPIEVELKENSLTPIRIVQGDRGGGNTLVFGFQQVDGIAIYDLTRNFFF